MTSLTGQRVHVVTPHYNPRGGVIKLLDYADHCARSGADVVVYSSDHADPGIALFGVDRFEGIFDRMRFEQHLDLPIEPDDLVLFTWPRDYLEIAKCAPAGFDQRRFVHMVQNTQNANVGFTRGYGRRLLRMAISRISVSDEVTEEIAPLVPAEMPFRTVAEGHDWQYFRPPSRQWPATGERPIRVGFVSWKSVRGHDVAARFGNDDRFEFRAIDDVAGWPQLRELYQWSDVFLGLPMTQEGFYMVGYEAMAAGAIVVVSDAEGNRAYCDFGQNCVEVGFDDAEAYAQALEALSRASAEEITTMRNRAYETVERFDLATERAEVVDFMAQLAKSVGPAL